MTGCPVFLVGLLLIASPALAQVSPPPPVSVPGLPQQPPRDTGPKTGTARIRGRVLAADTGQPLRKAQIRATSAEIRESRLATTDNNGVYEIIELPAGRYQLTATKGSFVQLQYGQTRPFETGKPLEVGDGQRIDKVDFNLPRGAIITGRVVDEVGEAVTDAQISVMRYGYAQGRRQLVSSGRFATTNDIGEYRIFGLPPGQYYVSATLRTGNPFDVASSSDRSGYAPTYHPGTPTVSEAQRLTIELGQTRAGIDVVLSPTRLARISGTAVDSDGKPIANAQLLIAQTSGQSIITISGGAQFRPDGSFTISNVTPGEYSIAVLQNTSSLTLGATSEAISATVTVAGEDIKDLRLIGVKASTVTGRVILPQAAAGTIRPASIQLTANAARPTPIPNLVGGGAGARVNDDFTFEMKVLPGQRVIRLSPQFQGATLKAVRRSGTDVTDDGIDVRPNEDISGVEIELTTQASELSGIVADVRGQAVKDYSLVVFARESARWFAGSRYLGTGRPDQDGRFKVRNLPPGEYYAIALDYVEPGAGTDPEYLERIRDRSTPFSMTEGGVKTLDLKLAIAP